MTERPLSSIIIDNYNYGRYLPDAIDSALAQTYPNVEVIVVDDGSTDQSRDVIARYGPRVTPLFKPNGGQASAFNAALPLSRGYAVHFLDSDDTILPTAIERAMERFADPAVVKVQWPLRTVDERGRPLGHVIPRAALPDGDVRDRLRGPSPDYPFPPQSGNMWRRDVLADLSSIPEEPFRTGGADLYLSMLCVLDGRVASVPESLGTYRAHSASHYTGLDFDARLDVTIRRQFLVYEALARRCRARGMEADAELWKQNSWLYKIQQSIREVAEAVPAGASLILADGDEWAAGPVFAGRRRFYFPEQDGQFWGAPADDTAAIAELSRLRRAGARFIIFAWPTFWWLDYYHGLDEYLQTRCRRLLSNDRLIIFELG